jgi:hypothetical protein
MYLESVPVHEENFHIMDDDSDSGLDGDNSLEDDLEADSEEEEEAGEEEGYEEVNHHPFVDYDEEDPPMKVGCTYG